MDDAPDPAGRARRRIENRALRTSVFLVVIFVGLWSIARDVRAGLIGAPIATVFYIALDSRPPRRRKPKVEE